jgi:hypothetical protein
MALPIQARQMLAMIGSVARERSAFRHKRIAD